GRFRIEYLRPAHGSWWARASSVAHRMGLGHAPSGTWIVFGEIALMIAITVLASRLVLRCVGSTRPGASAPHDAPSASPQAPSRPWTGRPAGGGRTLAGWAGAVRRGAARVGPVLRGVPRAAWICALIASLNAVCWSLITPPFQLPDEPAHFAYVQRLAET